MKTALFPGTFDPPTFGHLDIIQRAAPLCDHLIVAVSQPLTKQPTFTVQERLNMLKILTKNQPTIEIASFQGLAVDFAKEKKVSFLIRGLRTFADFEYEFQMALVNRHLGRLETLFLIPGEGHAKISSSFVREIASHGGPLSDFVPQEIEDLIVKKLRR